MSVLSKILTSSRDRFPLKNSFHAPSTFSTEMISLYACLNLPLITKKVIPPQRILPLLVRLKEVYILWHEQFAKLPKTSKYSIGAKIDMLFIESIEAVSVASFSPKNQKILPLQRAVIRVDTIKIFLQIAWEMKLIDTKRYIALSEKIAIIGKMLGGWYGQILKQNSPATVAKEK